MPLTSAYFAKDKANDIAVFEPVEINSKTKRSDLHAYVRTKNNKFPDRKPNNPSVALIFNITEKEEPVMLGQVAIDFYHKKYQQFKAVIGGGNETDEQIVDAIINKVKTKVNYSNTADKPEHRQVLDQLIQTIANDNGWVQGICQHYDKGDWGDMNVQTCVKHIQSTQEELDLLVQTLNDLNPQDKFEYRSLEAVKKSALITRNMNEHDPKAKDIATNQGTVFTDVTVFATTMGNGFDAKSVKAAILGATSTSFAPKP